MSRKPTYEELEKEVKALKEIQAALEKTQAALRDSEEKYRKSFESITDSITVTRINDGLYLYVNDGFCLQTGYSRGEVLGKTPSDINLYAKPVERDRFIGILKDYGKAEDVVVSFRRKSGEIYYSEFSAKPISYAGEACLLAQSRDITDRKRAEEALLKSKEKFRDLFDNAPLGYLEYDREGRIIRVNQTNLDMLGYKRDEMVGEFIWELYVEKAEAREQILAKLAGRLPPGRGFVRTYRRKDGTILPVLVEDRLLRDDREKISGIRCTFQDIMERKKAEEALKASQQRLSQIIDFLPDATMVIDLDGKVIAWNRAIEEMTCVRAEDILGKGDYEYAIPFYGEKRPVLIDLVGKWDKEIEKKYRYVKKEGKSLVSETFDPIVKPGGFLWNKASLLYDRDGNEIGAIESIRDISEMKAAEEALKESEEKYRVLVESTTDAIVLLDSARNMIACNKGFSSLFGYAEDEIKGESARLIHQSDEMFAQFGQIAYGSIEKTGTYQGEVYFRKKDGTLFPAETVTSAIEKDGSQTGYVGIIRDISTRKKKEEEKLRNEKDLRESQRIAHLGSWRLNLESNEVFWTEELYKMYGFDPKLPPPPYTEHMRLFTPGSWGLLSTSLAKTRDTGIPYELELEMVRNDGSRGWIWVRGEAITDSKGKATDLWGAAQDITDRKKMEEALRKSQEKYKHLFNEAQVALFRTFLDGSLVEINERYAQTAGYETVEECMANFHAGKAWPDREARDELIKKLYQDGSVNDYEAEIVRKDGTRIWINFSATIYPEKGYIEGSLIDVTARKMAEEDRERLQAQLNQTQKMEAIGRLAGGVAHDFNNMLSVIIGHSEIALLEVDPTLPLYQKLQQIRRAGERSADLTRQLLAFARKQTISPKVIDINKTVEDMIMMLQRLIGEDIDLAWLPGENVWPVKMDSSQIDQILANLCVNARDAITDVGKVTIETGNAEFDNTYCINHQGFIPGEYVLIAVSDNGYGMDSETLDNIFEPFFTTKDSGKGTGLGLATVYGVVKQNDGFVNVYSEPGQGATFKIYLPRYRTKAEALEEKVKALPAKRGHETILLVEDEPAILEITTMMLERLGYEVVAAMTPGEAIRLAQEYVGEIHLLVTDVVMPEMNGRDLAKNILSIHPNLRRLFMSGYTANVIAHHGVLDEGVNFIQKPFSMEKLGAKVREALDRDK